METRPRAQTSKQAKAAYKKNGPRIPEAELRQYDRLAELERRAQSIKDREKKRKAAQKQRIEREQREREAKVMNGFGIATQLAGFSHTQKNMKRGMEAFLGFNKGKRGESAEGSAEETLGAVGVEEDEEEEEDVMDISQVAEPVVEEQTDTMGIEVAEVSKSVMAEQKEHKTDPWDEDDLDEESLLDIAEEVITALPAPKTEPFVQPPLQQLPESIASLQSKPPPQSTPTLPLMAPPPPRTMRGLAEKHHLSAGCNSNILDESQGGKCKSTVPIQRDSDKKAPKLAPIKQRTTSLPKTVIAKSSRNPPSCRPFMKASVFRQIPQRDEWDDFLDSSTQIAREISVEPKAPQLPVLFICTQDLDMSLDDLDEIGLTPKDVPTKKNVAQPEVMGAPSNMPPPPRKIPSRTVTTESKPTVPRKGFSVNANAMLPPAKPIAYSEPLRQTRPKFTKESYGFSTQDMHAIVDDDIALSPG